MGLREDAETLGRYERAGLRDEYLAGTAPRLPAEPWPLDSSVSDRPIDNAAFYERRGE